MEIRENHKLSIQKELQVKEENNTCVICNKPVSEKIEALARSYSSRIVNLSGQSFDSVLNYVSVGHPVWVITSYAYIPGQYWETWYTAQGPIQMTDWEHSVLITGYDTNYVYFNDPLTGTNKRKPINDVKAGWEQLGQQAISYY